MEYTIAAIPTEYNGRRYRSRLEARWAAFFYLSKMEVEYEPADLGLWSPDFLVVSYKNWRIGINRLKLPALVEVKPIITFDKEVASRMVTAAKRAGFSGGLLLAGTSVASAWVFSAEPKRPVDLLFEIDDYSWDVDDEARIRGTAKATTKRDHLWNGACNAVQWRGRDA
jgi:hypothetical protein